MSYVARLDAAVKQTDTCLCVGIDPWLDRLPGRRGGESRAENARLARDFGLAVVSACRGQVPAVKPQFAFFEALGPQGMEALAEVCTAARAGGLLVVGDAKRGDIGSTAAAYAEATMSLNAPFPCDALTVSPFLGPDTLEPFLEAADQWGRGLYVLLRTSNPGSARWQAPVANDLAQWLEAQNVARGGSYGPVGAVVGATHADALRSLRSSMPHTPLLVPGFGAQGGAASTARAALDGDGQGALIVSARGATFPSAPDASYERDPAAWIRARVSEVVRELAAG